MTEMFHGASALGESVSDLFNPNSLNANKAYSAVTQQNRADRTSTFAQNQGVQNPSNNKSSIANENQATKTKAAATVDPLEVEAEWQARLAKFAGIAGATGAKLGGI
jgi:hypothetical protein